MVWRSGPPWRTRKTCVKTLKSQMMDRNAVIRNSGRSTGRISDRKVCQAPAPSTRMASYSSRGIAVSPAYSVRATNGIACQTMIRVMIAKVDRPVSNQLWLEKSPRPAALSTQLTTPNWVSNSHCQTTVAVSGGVAQASTSAIDTASRIPLWSRSSSSASSVASTIVSATQAAVNTTVRTVTDQPDEHGGALHHVGQVPLQQRDPHDLVERVAEQRDEGDDGGEAEQER